MTRVVRQDCPAFRLRSVLPCLVCRVARPPTACFCSARFGGGVPPGVAVHWVRRDPVRGVRVAVVRAGRLGPWCGRAFRPRPRSYQGGVPQSKLWDPRGSARTHGRAHVSPVGPAGSNARPGPALPSGSWRTPGARLRRAHNPQPSTHVACCGGLAPRHRTRPKDRPRGGTGLPGFRMGVCACCAGCACDACCALYAKCAMLGA